MKTNPIREAFNAATPTSDQKARMRAALEAQLPEEKPNQGRYQERHTPPRRFSWIPALAALFVVVIIGGFALGRLYGGTAELSPAQITGPTAVGTEDVPLPTMETTTEYDPALFVYEFILEKYVSAINEDWDGARCAEADISIMVSFLESPDSLGYALMDLDGNGNQELIITDGNVIYDLYTLTDDGPAHVFSGWERNAYYLCDGNVIKNVGSNSAASSFTAFFKLDGIDFRYQDTVSFNADMDSENPWFLASNFSDTLSPITEEEANAILDSYAVIPIETRPLTEHP